MNRKILIWIFFGFHSLVPIDSLARESNSFYEFYKLFKNSPPAQYQVTGTICEQVAKKQLESYFSDPEYTIQTGITYQRNGKTLGELDLVVFRNSDHQAILVGEVKCRRNLVRARRKAKQQLKRFAYAIESKTPMEIFDPDHPEARYHFSQFENIKSWITISQKGGKRAGFDWALDLTLHQLLKLRRKLLTE